MPRTILYSAKLCGDCQHLKRFMDAHGLPYEVRNIDEVPAYADELETHTGKQGVPFLRIDDRWVRGYEPGRPFTEEFARSLFGL
jgi:glutaredoxin